MELIISKLHLEQDYKKKSHWKILITRDRRCLGGNEDESCQVEEWTN